MSKSFEKSGEGNAKSCPFCGRMNQRDAEICEHCELYVSSSSRTGAWIEWVPFRILWRLFLGMLILLCGFFLLWILVPGQSYDTGHRPRHPCKNNLKMIGLALHIYHDKFGSFPPAYLADANGKPMHSWRVLILPFLDEGPLYKQYDFSKPWDAPENADVLQSMPDIFRCPDDVKAAPNTTSYAGVFGNGCIFDPERAVKIRDIKDGTTTTVMVGEVVGGDIPWTKPEDIDVADHPTINQPGGFGSNHEDGAQFLMGDGAVRFIANNRPADLMFNFFHRNDGNKVGDASFE